MCPDRVRRSLRQRRRGARRSGCGDLVTDLRRPEARGRRCVRGTLRRGRSAPGLGKWRNDGHGSHHDVRALPFFCTSRPLPGDGDDANPAHPVPVSGGGGDRRKSKRRRRRVRQRHALSEQRRCAHPCEQGGSAACGTALFFVCRRPRRAARQVQRSIRPWPQPCDVPWRPPPASRPTSVHRFLAPEPQPLNPA